MTIRNKPFGLSDVWGCKACPPQSVFYELEGDSAALAKKALEGERVHLLEVKGFNLTAPQTLVFLGEKFRAAAYYPTLYKLSLTEGTARYFASVPVSYNRDFTPLEQAREITDESEYGHIMMGLFANGHSTPQQVEVKAPEDAEFPEDFYPETSLFHLSVFDIRM